MIQKQWSNFDKLYNKRHDMRLGDQSLIMRSGAQQMLSNSPSAAYPFTSGVHPQIQARNHLYAQAQLKGSLKNESSVGQCMSLGQSLARRQETSSNQYGKFTYKYL